ncbi:MAG: hypothetical protein Fur0023_10750 [Bacteroidia bacterium]
MNNDFIKVGTGDGESFPFMERGEYTSKDTDNVSTSFSNVVDGLKIGDGTSILGYYIAMLATEYYLLKQNNQNTDSTLYELYCALYAFNRVDIKAEKIDGHNTGILNGFFIRDDVPYDFVKTNYNHFNYYTKGISNNSQSRGFMSKFQSGMSRTTSSYAAYQKYNDKELLYESQDQAYNMLYGLAFVRKFVDDYAVAKDKNGNTLYFQDGQIYIREEAKAIAKRIVDHIRDPKRYDGVSCNGNISTGWHIKNAITCNNVSTGDNATWFSYPLAESECMINSVIKIIPTMQLENSYSPIYSPSYCSGPFDFPGTFHNIFSRTSGYPLWLNTPTGGLLNVDTKVFVGNLGCVCNCYYTGEFFIRSNSTPSMLSSLVYQPVTNVSSSYPYVNPPIPAPLHHPLISWYLLHFNNMPYYSYTPTYGLSQKINEVYNILSQVPCNDIYYLVNENPKYASYQWSSDNRCDHPNRLGGSNFQGEYNGIDFLLYHNLWYSYKSLINNSNQYISNLSHIFIDKNNKWYFGDIINNPTQTILISKTTPIEINAFETVIIQKTEVPIFKDGYIRSGKSILLKPGTWLRPATSLDTCTECIATDSPETFKTTFRLYVKGFSSACENGSVCEGCRVISDTNNVNTEFKQKHFFHYINYNSLISRNVDSIETNTTNNKDEKYDNIELYPNPASDNVTIKMPFSKAINLEIFNTLGLRLRIIQLKECDKTCTISLDNIPSGIYYVKISGTPYIFKLNIVK